MRPSVMVFCGAQVAGVPRVAAAAVGHSEKQVFAGHVWVQGTQG